MSDTPTPPIPDQPHRDVPQPGPVPSAYPPAHASGPYGPYPGPPYPGPVPPARKSHTAVILLAVGIPLLILVLVGAAAFVVIARSNSGDTRGGGDLGAANAKTAAAPSDFQIVCRGGRVTNAAPYGAPFTFLAFSRSRDDRGSWSTVSLATDTALYPGGVLDPKALARVNAVACATEIDGAAAKAMTCTFTDNGSEKQVPLYATRYRITAYDARTGRKVKELGEVSAPGTRCPILALMNPRDPRITADPDQTAVRALLTGFTG